MITIRNEYIEAVIEERGAQLCSLKNLKNGCELLWEGNPEFWKYHAPVLFPFVGSLNGKEYRYLGRTFQSGQHGFARESNFHLVSHTDIAALYVLEADEQTREKYPFDFRLEIEQRLENNHLAVNWKVINPDQEKPLYFSIGAHPAFRVPCKGTDRKTDCYVYFPGKDTLSYILKDLKEDTADTEHVYEMRLDGGYLKIEDHLFDIDTFIFENGQVSEVSLCGSDKVPYVTVHCKGFPYFGLWTKSDAAPFVCLEPWFGRLDDKGFTGELPEKTGIVALEPGATFEAAYDIEV